MKQGFYNSFSIPSNWMLPFVALFLLGLFFPVKVAQSIGLVVAVIAGAWAWYDKPKLGRDGLWLAVCLLMLLAGCWGSLVAPDPEVSWKVFWGYQTIGKGLLCALALFSISLSGEQIRRLLIFLFVMLIARNLSMILYAYNHPVFLGGAAIESDVVLLNYRNQADHILVLFPFVLASAVAWPRYVRFVLLLMAFEIVLLASTGWRGAWVGFAGECIVLLAFFRNWRVLGLLVFCAVAIGVTGLLFSPDNIVASAISRGFGDSNRIKLVWSPVLDMLAQSDWRGFGFGQARYLELISEYAKANAEKGIPVLGDAHNMVLNFAMAAGWLGALAFVAVLGAGVVLPLARARTKDLSVEQTVFLVATAVAWFGSYGLLGLTDQPHYNDLAVLLVLTSVALASCRERPAA